MNEIEKMYENAGVETNKYKLCCTGCKHIAKVEIINGYPSKWICNKYNEVANCDKAEPDYPPFTAEKQLLLLQLLARIESADYFQFFFYGIKQEWVFRLNMLTELFCESAYIYESRNKNFDECIAGLINIIWQDLTEEEKQQVKGILSNEK